MSQLFGRWDDVAESTQKNINVVIVGAVLGVASASGHDSTLDANDFNACSFQLGLPFLAVVTRRGVLYNCSIPAQRLVGYRPSFRRVRAQYPTTVAQ